MSSCGTCRGKSDQCPVRYQGGNCHQLGDGQDAGQGGLPVNDGLPERCLRVARGEVVPPSTLFMVQDFAVRLWW
ncbi:MAG: hypothetical protein J2P29_02385, partial [Actinobacteria bacterium]|nr:hypothetical protein [Actinomycetota bacterium]